MLKLRIAVAIAIAGLIAATWFLWPHAAAKTAPITVPKAEAAETPQPPALSVQIKQYLEKKKSPLATEAEFLSQQKHWQLLIAISAIESQFCKRQLGYNCWGISAGSGKGYRKYKSYHEAIADADTFIEKWQVKGKWLTIDSMNCSYVVPCSSNWVKVVKKTYDELNFKEPAR